MFQFVDDVGIGVYVYVYEFSLTLLQLGSLSLHWLRWTAGEHGQYDDTTERVGVGVRCSKSPKI